MAVDFDQWTEIANPPCCEDGGGGGGIGDSIFAADSSVPVTIFDVTSDVNSDVLRFAWFFQGMQPANIPQLALITPFSNASNVDVSLSFNTKSNGLDYTQPDNAALPADFQFTLAPDSAIWLSADGLPNSNYDLVAIGDWLKATVVAIFQGSTTLNKILVNMDMLKAGEVTFNYKILNVTIP